MIKPRAVLEHANNQQQFIERAEANDLTVLTLDQLAERYNQIDQQSQLFKGLILLEARERFKSDKEFGQWIATAQLFDSSRQGNANYMNLARFFKNKDMTGISLTAAYEIAAPKNADIANEVYSYALLKNLPVAEVKRQIALKKGVAGTSNLATSVEPPTPVQQVQPTQAEPIAPPPPALLPVANVEPVEPATQQGADYNEQRESLLFDLTFILDGHKIAPNIKIAALKECIAQINAQMSLSDLLIDELSPSISVQYL
jgi:hypothetical protein